MAFEYYLHAAKLLLQLAGAHDTVADDFPYAKGGKLPCDIAEYPLNTVASAPGLLLQPVQTSDHIVDRTVEFTVLGGNHDIKLFNGHCSTSLFLLLCAAAILAICCFARFHAGISCRRNGKYSSGVLGKLRGAFTASPVRCAECHAISAAFLDSSSRRFPAERIRQYISAGVSSGNSSEYAPQSTAASVSRLISSAALPGG